MLRSKSFVKKTRKGAVVKVVREHYLRDDVWCGVKGCGKCKQETPPLEACPVIESDLCPHPHYLLPDTNVVLHQLDFLEDPAITNAIILQVVLQEVKHQNLGAYKRIRDQISNPSKRFYVFANEHHRETFVERGAEESANDRNDRAIRTSAKWYDAHLARHAPKGKGEGSLSARVVLLTGDRANRDKARSEGVESRTVFEYVRSLMEHPSLLDCLSGGSGGSNGGGTNAVPDSDSPTPSSKKDRVLFPEHLPLSAVQTGLRVGRYLQGVFQGSRENHLEGFMRVEGMERFVFIQGRAHLNRAIHGDLVAMEMLPEGEWAAPSGVVTKVVESARDEEEAEEEEEKEVLNGMPEDSTAVLGKGSASGAGKGSSEERRPTGRVVGIIKRNWRAYCGTLLPSPHHRHQAPPTATITGASRRHTFLPADRCVPPVWVETRQAHTLLGKRVLVGVDAWPRTSRLPRGHYVRTLGEIGERETETEVLLLEHEVPHQSFSAAVLADLPPTPWTVTPDDLQARCDLRHLDVCSVDPPGCTDIDDALHCRPLVGKEDGGRGNLEVGVHIADVSHFVRPGTALDREARNRGTTVYLADRRIDMVPELLGSNLCSLRGGGEERLAFSVIWEMTPEAEVVSTRFCKSVIRSRAALTYAEAQMRIDDATLSDPVTLALRRLNGLAKILKRSRVERGALTLASPEIRFEVDSETHDPIDLQAKELKETNSLVEEFMLLANISVARRIFEEFPHCALLRRHPSPPPSNYDILVKAAGCKGAEISIENAKALASSLDRAVLPDEPYFNTMLRILATRCMMQALYFCSGTLPQAEFHHYGLASPIYTHFTSPIRRYSDLVVHRLLAVSIRADSTYADLLDKEKTQQLCNLLNRRHKNAQYAARASINLHTQLFFKKRLGSVEEAFVLFVKRNALQVLVPKFGLEGNIFFDDVENDVAVREGGVARAKVGGVAAKKLALTFLDSEPSLTVEGVKFRLFDKVVVRISVEQSSIQHSRLRLCLLHPQVPGLGTGEGGAEGRGQGGSEEDRDIVPPDTKKRKLL